MPAADVQVYLNRARDFLEGVRLLRSELSTYGCSSALLAIHGALSYCDALRIGLGEDKLSSDDHSKAPAALKQLLTNRRYEKLEGIARLSRLLASKSDVAYGRESIQISKAKSLIEQSERFVVWAETLGKELRIEGWSDDNF